MSLDLFLWYILIAGAIFLAFLLSFIVGLGLCRAFVTLASRVSGWRASRVPRRKA